jgi:hypothetical protein
VTTSGDGGQVRGWRRLAADVLWAVMCVALAIASSVDAAPHMSKQRFVDEPIKDAQFWAR